MFRVERGMSRRELAELVGVNPQTIGFLERGEYGPSLILALKIAAVFGVPVETLFALEPFPSLGDQLSRLSRSDA
jgi:putative transcriptional regulator